MTKAKDSPATCSSATEKWSWRRLLSHRCAHNHLPFEAFYHCCQFNISCKWHFLQSFTCLNEPNNQEEIVFNLCFWCSLKEHPNHVDEEVMCTLERQNRSHDLQAVCKILQNVSNSLEILKERIHLSPLEANQCLEINPEKYKQALHNVSTLIQSSRGFKVKEHLYKYLIQSLRKQMPDRLS
jgi:hypothetical protein